MKVVFLLIALSTISGFAKSNDYTDIRNRLSFSNSGGLFNGGVCWWHSRLQRSAFYLTSFQPQLPKPNKKELKYILRKLRYMNRKVQIPGFKNFAEFSNFYQMEIQKLLNHWQIYDGFIYQQWIRGLSGSAKDVSSNSYKMRMNKLYERFQSQKFLPWVMLQLPGIESHAYLIIGMIRTARGYNLEVIDSNRPTQTVRIVDRYSQALYLGFESDIHKIQKALSREK